MAESTGKFEQAFQRVLEEDMTAAGVGVGSTGGGSTGGDAMQGPGVYGDPNEIRMPKALGKVQRRADVDPKKKKKKKKKKKAKKTKPVFHEEIKEA